jgi:hypothetical protein
MFDPNSITPSADVLTNLCTSEAGLILAARWGAAQAVESLRHQWPEPITDRPPTVADGNGGGLVQYLWFGQWNFAEWYYVAAQRYDWLHTPNWRPKPDPTLKQRAIEIVNCSRGFPCSPMQAETLLAALALIPEPTTGS